MASKTALSIDNLSISVGETPLTQKVTFSLQSGKTLALVGESGSGKSITALSLLGLLPDSMHCTGTVTYAKTDLLTTSPAQLQTIRGAHIGMIFQEPMTSLNPLHTIGKQLAESITLHQSLPEPALKARVLELLQLVELGQLTTRLHAFPHELSGGQRQRVMIAMALANNPDILIADEPTTALDVTVQAHILSLLQKLQTELGMAVLLITHDLSIVKQVAHRIAVMKDGKLVETGTVKQIFGKPKHAYTKKLMHSVPKGDPVPLPAHPIPKPTDGSERRPNEPQVVAEDMPILQTAGLTVRYPLSSGFLGWGKRDMVAVKNASLLITRGQTVGIVGESGSGKTTLAMALLRLVNSTGPIIFQGHALDLKTQKELRPLRKQMQVVFQDPFSSLNPRLTVGEIIGEGLRAHEQTTPLPLGEGGERSEPGEGSATYENPSPQPSPRGRGSDNTNHHSLITHALTDVGLDPETANRYPHEFSGGQRQRIAIARALVLNPSLIVLDEPTSALDVSTQSSILTLLKTLQKDRGLAYLFITHDLRVIRTIAHHILVMKDGEIIEAQDNKPLFDTPQQDYTQQLLNAALV